MRKNNLIQLLKSFDNKELNRFYKFLSSPYFNADKRIIHLFTLLREQVLQKQEVSFNDDLQTKIYQKLFSDIDPSKEYITPNQKKILAVRLSILGKLAKRFLMIEALEEDPSCEIRLLNKKILNKKQYNLFEQSCNNHLKKIKKNKTIDLPHYTQAVQLELSRMAYLSKDVFLKEDNFPDLIKNLDLYYLIWRLRVHITMKSTLLNNPEKQYDNTLLLAITPLLNLPNYANNPLLILYRTTLELIQTNQEENYYRLVQLLDQYHEDISKVDLTGFYTVATNFCSQQSRKKNQLKYFEETFRLYKFMEQKNLLVEGKVLQIKKLVNLVDIGCKVKNFKWTFELVKKYYRFVQKEKQESTKHLLLGMIHFHQKEYETVLEHLIQVKELGMPYDMLVRFLRLQSSYELDTHYSFYTMQVFISTQSFIRNQKEIPKERKKSYQNFIQLLINLYKVRHQEGRITLTRVKEKMAKMDLIDRKKWLLEKIKELSYRG